LAKPNYAYEKRQKELAKQRKKQDKLQRKAHHPDARSDQTDNAELPQSGAAASDPAAQKN
jgi:hypothetical protein